jgi:rhodanese-related sulfurtransferase
MSIVLAGCNPFQIRAEYRKISQQEAQEMIDNNDDIVILDVRTQEEFDSGHISNAILLPYDETRENIESIIADRNQTILVYCEIGIRSETAARELVAMGYRNVFDFGGIADWTGEIVYFDFTVNQKIHNDMPEFIFHIRGTNVPEDFSESSVVSITITNENGDLIQEITDLNTMGTRDRFPPNGIPEMYGFSFDDWNFDGFMDISLWRSPGGTMRNNPTYYWLWDNSIGQYVRNEQLENMSNWSTPRIYEELQLVECFTRSGWDWNATVYFEYQNGSFVEVKYVERNVGRPDDENNYDTRITVNELINGKWVVTNEYIIDREGEIIG